ncbi:uncharacterized protein [Scyliorhinus torazame]|uniref:uncharacterized protein n=1 Tax=Scyliorhinus torazame TaxID=75743 RepID=UPI003B5D031D
MHKRKKTLPVATKVDGTLLPVVKKARKKNVQPDEEQNTDTFETEDKTTTEEQETEDITMKPAEEEELASGSLSVEHAEKRTGQVEQEIEGKGDRANRSQDGEHFLFPLSQNSLGKYVPVFPKLKNRLSRSNLVKHDIEITDKESLRNSNVEGDKNPQDMDLEISGCCLPAAKHQVQMSQQSPEQTACNATSSQPPAKESGKEQKETEAAGRCVKERSDGDVALSDAQMGADMRHVGHEAEELTCPSDQRNSDITEVENESNKLDQHLFEMDMLCRTPIPIAHSTPDEQPLTQSECTRRSFSKDEPDFELSRNSLYQEQTDVVPVAHEELALCQGAAREYTIAINKDVDGTEERCVLPAEVYKNSSCREKTDNLVVVSEELTGSEGNRQELAVPMNLTTDRPAQNDLKDETCSQSTDLLCSSTLHHSLESNAVIQVKNTFNSQADTMDRHKNASEELQESPSCEAELSVATRNDSVLQDVDACQKDGDWSDLSGPNNSRTAVAIAKTLHKDSGGHQPGPQPQPSPRFPGDKTMEIDRETLPERRGEMEIENQKITQNLCKSFHGQAVPNERCNSTNCSNAGEETKQLIQEVLNNSHSNSLLTADLAEKEYHSAAQSAGPGGQCVRQQPAEHSEAPSLNTMLLHSQTNLLPANRAVDISESTGAFKVHGGSSCGAEPPPGRQSGITGSQGLEITEKELPVIGLNSSQQTTHSSKNEGILPGEANAPQILFDSNCNRGVIKDNKGLDSKMRLGISNELSSSMFLSLDNTDFQIETNLSNISEEKDKVGFGRRESQCKTGIKRMRDDVTLSPLLTGTGMEHCVVGRQQEDKAKKAIQAGGSISTGIECGRVNISNNQEPALKEQSAQPLMGHIAERGSSNESGTFGETGFPVEKMDMELGSEMSGDADTLPKTGATRAAIPVAFPLYQPPEDFTKGRGCLSVVFPPAGNETRGHCSDSRDVNTETGRCGTLKERHWTSSIVSETKGCSFSMVGAGSSSKEQEIQCRTATQSANQGNKSEQKPFPCTKSKVLTKLTHDEVQPDNKDRELPLMKPTLESKAVTDLSPVIAPPEDNANFASELEDLHLSESDWQAFSPSAEEEEDATHVVCGLINELSKINRAIMFTHRELESMRRNKNRRGRPVGRHISRGATNVTYSAKRKDL